ncbi:HGGxSTG domain-containing protein [Citricoccus sp. GCM10030269]|uniref:HGGxSTG domain-containing protein n=1 Tax=Citricoccus sp. GCM10030269 TaxID=3273388 RepID=UPI003622E3C3
MHTTCKAHTRSGARCKNRPIIGATVCRMHGGSSPRVRAAAERRVAEDSAREILGTIDPDAPDEHPVETLLILIRQKRAEVMWLQSVVRGFSEDQLIWGLAEHRTGIGPEGPVDVETRKTEQNVWWRLLREAENQLASWTIAAAKAGVDERRLQIAEAEAAMIVRILETFINRLQLTPERHSEARDIMAGVLRELDQAEQGSAA